MSAAALYRFKEIVTVPSNTDMIDIVMSKTQRKTPTEIHPQFKITRIRNFYMRKVKYAQTTFNETFTRILTQFPKIDEIHPFYSDLCNVLYDRDHYKLALGQIAGVRSLVDKIAKDYVKLLKFSDSLYKCNMLKRAGLGRMCTCIKKLSAPLKYLEEVRQHLGRLPQLNPNTRSLILTGYPNVGKSSFMNSISQANVDVQPYAFTTKSLYVGHFDYNYERWQIIDTPGILDHPLDERNTIEMAAITALAHVEATVLFVIDISEECMYSIEEQVQLFHSLKPLFTKNPIVVVLNKIDIRDFSTLTDHERASIESMRPDMSEDNIGTYDFMTCSTLKKDRVDTIKNHAASLLLSKRVDDKVKMSRIDSVANRIYVTHVELNPNRPAKIPESVKRKLEKMEELEEMETEDEFLDKIYCDRFVGPSGGAPELSSETLRHLQARAKDGELTEKDLSEAFGGAGVYDSDLRKNFELTNSEWNYDIIPEIIQGYNIADFVDEEIEAKLEALEMEEEVLERQFDEFLTDEVKNEHREWLKIQEEKILVQREVKLRKLERRMKKGRNAPSTEYVARNRGRGRSMNEIDDHLQPLGYDTSKMRERLRSRSVAFENRYGETALRENQKVRKTTRNLEFLEKERSRDLEAVQYAESKIVRRRELGISKKEDQVAAENHRRRSQSAMHRKGRFQEGESDRKIVDKMPKHLFSGKRGMGKTDRR